MTKILKGNVEDFKNLLFQIQNGRNNLKELKHNQKREGKMNITTTNASNSRLSELKEELELLKEVIEQYEKLNDLIDQFNQRGSVIGRGMPYISPLDVAYPYPWQNPVVYMSESDINTIKCGCDTIRPVITQTPDSWSGQVLNVVDEY